MESLVRGIRYALEGNVSESLEWFRFSWVHDSENEIFFIPALLSMRWTLLTQSCHRVPGWVWTLNFLNSPPQKEISRPIWLCFSDPLLVLLNLAKSTSKWMGAEQMNQQIFQLHQWVSQTQQHEDPALHCWLETLYWTMRLHKFFLQPRADQETLALGGDTVFRCAERGFYPAQRLWLLKFGRHSIRQSLPVLLEWIFDPPPQPSAVFHCSFWRRHELAYWVAVFLEESSLPSALSRRWAKPWWRVYAENTCSWIEIWGSNDPSLRLWPDFKVAERWCHFNVWRGSSEAQYFWSQHLLLQLKEFRKTPLSDLIKNLQASEHWLELSASQGCQLSQGFLTLISYPDDGLRDSWGRLQFRLGRWCETHQLMTEAIRWFRRSHRQGRLVAGYFWALLIKNENPSLAFDLFSQLLACPLPPLNESTDDFRDRQRLLASAAHQAAMILSVIHPVASSERLKEEERLYNLAIDFDNPWQSRVNLSKILSHHLREPHPDYKEVAYQTRLAIRDHPEEALAHYLQHVSDPQNRSNFRLLASLSDPSWLHHPPSFLPDPPP